LCYFRQISHVHFFCGTFMKRFLIFSGLGVVILILMGSLVLFFYKRHTKSFSPEEEVTFESRDLKIKVIYNRPNKKGRVIFGGLVPYDEVWRTGANEATTFSSNLPLKIQGKTLNAGKYSLWTIPRENQWSIIFNDEIGQWGINTSGEANRIPSRDVLSVDVTAMIQDREIEQFTISFEAIGEEAEMVLMWDKTVIALPFSYP